jgi:hypothetical protein
MELRVARSGMHVKTGVHARAPFESMASRHVAARVSLEAAARSMVVLFTTGKAVLGGERSGIQSDGWQQAYVDAKQNALPW